MFKAHFPLCAPACISEIRVAFTHTHYVNTNHHNNNSHRLVERQSQLAHNERPIRSSRRLHRDQLNCMLSLFGFVKFIESE